MEKGLTGSHLKIIAVTSMALDHFAAAVLPVLLRHSVGGGGWLVDLYHLLRHIGRFAFPLYCFLLAEGFSHTRSVPKYVLRLALFAVVSEIPFDLALNCRVMEFNSNNVFFTLFTGLLTIWAMDQEKAWSSHFSGLPALLPRFLWYGVAAAAGYLLAEYVLRCDYGGAGVLAIAAIWLLKNQPAAGFLACVGILSIGNPIELYALPMLLPVYLYNGLRGKGGKWWFYMFYPAHLLVYWGIVLILG